MILMNITYNPKGVGDVLIMPIQDGNQDEVIIETNGPITKITDKDKNVLGYNIFQASTNLNLTETGQFPLTEELLDEIKQLFKANQLDDKLEFDLSPKFVVGYVVNKAQHKNADKLSVCEVDVGDETLQIVCGAPNVEAGQKVVVAKIGAVMPSGLQIKPTTLRDVPSNGMICSKKELGLPQAAEEKGIYVLSENHQAGDVFVF